jgi:small subunit ribosomal protein S6
VKLNKYETVIVIRTDITEDQIEAFHAKLFDMVKKVNGHEIKLEVWGKRKLAYEIKKNMKGIYIYYLYLAPAGGVEELERGLRLNELVLRFLTVNLEANVDPDNYDFTSERELSFKRLSTEEDEERPATPAAPAAPAAEAKPAEEGAPAAEAKADPRTDTTTTEA